MTDYVNYQGYKGADPEKIRSELRSTNGIQKTEALFEEVVQASSRENNEPPYTLKDYESQGKISAYQVYMNAIDETDAALKLVGSLQHWRKLCSRSWFVNGRPDIGFPGLSAWREDMVERDRMFAKEVLINQAKEGNVSAARALEKMASDEVRRLDSRKVPKKSKGRDDGVDEDLAFLENYRG